jgi:hypothetical protein
MSTIRFALFFVLLVFITQASALAQNPAATAGSQTPVPAVTASASGADSVRFASPGQILQIRLEIYSNNGQLVFDSGLHQGNVIDWKLSDASQPLGDGQFVSVVTVRDFQGKFRQRLGGISLQGGQVTLKNQAQQELTSAQTKAIDTRRQSQKVEAADNGDAVTILRDGKERSVVVTGHDGVDGQVATTSGALTFRTGDFFSNRAKEQMRIMPDGRVGIGTDHPETTLDVAGAIRARDGIQFADGTVLKSAADIGRQSNVSANVISTNGSTTTPLAPQAGAGTTNTLAKWVDGAGTAGDSLLAENGTSIVHRGTNFQFTAAADGLVDTNLMFLDNTNKTMGMLAGPTPAFVAQNGPYFALRGNTYSTFANQRGVFAISAGQVTSPAAGEGSIKFLTGADQLRLVIDNAGQVGIGTGIPTQKLEVGGNIRISGATNGLIFPDGSKMTSALAGGTLDGTGIINAVNDPATTGTINDNRLSPNLARLGGANVWSGANIFNLGLSANGAQVTNVGNPINAGDAVNKSFFETNAVRFTPPAAQVSVGDANGTFTMINLRGGSTCCGGPGGYTPADFKVFQNGSFVATGNLGIGVSPMEGKGYRTSWHTYKGAFRSGYADNEWDDANTGFFSWAGGSNSTASGLYALAFGDTNFARSTSSIVFGSGNEVKGAAGFSAGAGNRVCDTYGVALGNNAKSGGPYISGKCDPDSFNIRGLAAIAIGYNVTADQDHSMAFGKFASNNGFSGTFVWSDGSATASADTFKNLNNNEFAARATGGFRFRTNLTGSTGCNLPAGSGVFNCTSSRVTKENFMLVNGDDVLTRLRKVPVSSWNYISEGNASRHLGPMAEDFYEAFKLGPGNTSIGVQDLTGVSLAAIKALDQRTSELQQKTVEVEQLRAQMNELRLVNTEMEKRLTALEQSMQKAATKPATRKHKSSRARR